MNKKEIESLIAEGTWRDLLRGLGEGTYEMFFPNVDKIKSFKATAYEFNGDRMGKTYSISVDKEHLFVKVKVTLQ